MDFYSTSPLFLCAYLYGPPLQLMRPSAVAKIGETQQYVTLFELVLNPLLHRFIQTSNIFVANLPPNITEATLGNFFAKHGPIGSVSNEASTMYGWI